MVTLTQAATYSKKVAIYGILLTILLILLIISWGLFRDYLESQKPEPGIVTTNGFGKLPKINFPDEKNRPAILTLQTIEGGVPEATSVARVYKTQKNLPSLLAAKNAQQFAKSQSFDPTPVTKTISDHTFKDSNYSARSLIYNLSTGNFDIIYDLSTDSSPIESSAISIDTNLAISEAITTLQNMGKFVPELESGTQNVTYLRYQNREFTPVQNRIDANLVRVDFMKGSILDLELKTPNPGESSIYVIFSGKGNAAQRIVRFYYQLFPVNLDSLQTYPIKKGNVAWEELVGGRGYVANSGIGNESQVFVRNAYFAFYDSGEFQEYLQPIYVFTGDRGFEAYVYAIDPAWVQ